MEDFNGNPLENGWYWYSHMTESDVFYPVLVDLKNNYIVSNREIKPIAWLEGFDLFKAVMPEQI